MDISKKSKDSYEGNGLSVSICPSAWESIAKIASADIWELKKEDIKLLDYYSIPKKDYNKVTQWGIENGFLKEVFGRYGFSFYSDDIGRDMHILCDNLEDAFLEAGIEGSYRTYEEYLASDEGDEDMIYPIKSYEATDKLKENSLIYVEEGKCAEEQNFLLYVEKFADYDGVY